MMTLMTTSKMRMKIKKKSKKDNKELRETGASFSVGQVRQRPVLFRAPDFSGQIHKIRKVLFVQT